MSRVFTLLKPAKKIIRGKLFDLSSAVLPADFTYTRTGNATYRDATGTMQVAAANVRRVAYDLNGNLLGTTIEPAITNKLTDRNCNPTDTTGWMKGGDALATFSVVADPSGYLAAQKLGSVCSAGKLYKIDNSLGSAPALITSVATFGTAAMHTISLYLAAVGGNVTLTRTGTSPASLVIPPGTFARHALQVSPSASDQMQLIVPAGGIAFFIGAQMEDSAFSDRSGKAVATSLVPTNAAATARGADNLSILSLNTKSYYNESQGAVVIDCIPRGFGAAGPQFLFSLQEGTGQTNMLAARISQLVASDTGYVRRQIYGQGSSLSSTSTHKPEPGKPYRVALSWKPGMTTLFSQADCLDETMNDSGGATRNPAGMDRLLIGTWRFGRDYFLGHVRKVKLYRQYRPVPQLGPDMFDPGDKAIVYAGQSNAYGHFRAQVDQNNSGETNALAVMNQWVTSPGRNWLLNAATNGSLAFGSRSDSGLPSATTTPYWYDDETNQLSGSAWIKYRNLVQAFRNAGGQLLFTMWKQGDGGQPWTMKQKYKDTLGVIFNGMGALIPSHRILIDQLSRYIDPQDTDNQITQSVREVNWELAAERADCVRGPECADLPIDDYAHFDDALGYGVHGGRLMRKMLSRLGYAITSDVDGPRIVSAVRSGTTVDVTLSHESGTDFTPTSGFQGFVCYQGNAETGTPISVTAQTRVNATTIQLTLASTPSGPATLYYLFDQLYHIDPTKLILSNAANALPLRAAKLSV